MATSKEITSIMRGASDENIALVEKAYSFAQHAHEGQERYSGDPYFVHLAETAKLLAQWRMEPKAIAAGLIHDTIEDANITDEEIENEFGNEILFLIEGVTKLGKLKYRGLERHVESLRKLFVATSQDIRVLVIKLADKLHNMRTLSFVPEHKQKRLALEALEIYSPLASRLGMGRVRGELEDLAFPYIFSKEYQETLTLIKQKTKTGQEYLEKIYRSLHKELAKHNIKAIAVDYRKKHLYSLWKKLKRYEMDIDKVHDIVALRIIVPTIEDCYRVLGIIHNMWRPLPGRVKDYIAVPKPNGYQSLHTTIFTGDGGAAEVQIRTQEMHEEAEYGIAAWFAYKEESIGKSGAKKKKYLGDDIDAKYAWVRELYNLKKATEKPDALLTEMKTDLFEDRIFIFTPKGDVIDLPLGSGPIDFAYAIHSDIGEHTAGVKINGKMMSLNTKLKSGDIVEIVTKKDAHPSSKWLEYTKTTSARKHVKQYVDKNSLIGKIMKRF